MYRATLFWLFTIPMYWVSLVFLWVFYAYGHIWKKNEVSVGYEYDEDSHGVWERQFKGHWVSFTNNDNDIDQDHSAVLQENLIPLEVILMNPPNEQDSERDSELEQVSSS